MNSLNLGIPVTSYFLLVLTAACFVPFFWIHFLFVQLRTSSSSFGVLQQLFWQCWLHCGTYRPGVSLLCTLIFCLITISFMRRLELTFRSSFLLLGTWIPEIMSTFLSKKFQPPPASNSRSSTCPLPNTYLAVFLFCTEAKCRDSVIPSAFTSPFSSFSVYVSFNPKSGVSFTKI